MVDSTLAQIKAEYAKNPNKVFSPDIVEHVRPLYLNCPHDGTPLAFLRVYDYNVDGVAPCCLQCKRLFVMDAFKQMSYRARAQLVIQQNKKALTPNKPSIVLPIPEKITDSPPSTILIATLFRRSGQRVGEVAIVAKYAEQNHKKGFYWVGRELPSRILAAIKLDPDKKVKYHGYWYTVKYRSKNITLKDKYLSIITRFCNPAHKQIAYLYEHSKRGEYERKGECVMAMVACTDETFPVPVPVIFMPSSGNYYLDEEIYIEVAKKHGLPWLQPIDMSYCSNNGKPTFSNMKRRSFLNLLGYSVSLNYGPTLDSRRRLLMALIDGGIMPAYTIKRHLWMLIDLNKSKLSMVDAVQEWRDDIEFLMKYEARDHESVWVSVFWSSRESLIRTAPEE